MHKNLKCLFFITLLFVTIGHETLAQNKSYFPDKNWIRRKPSEFKLENVILDSAIAFAFKNENKVEKDLRLALYKSYANEPNYKIIGPVKERGGPAGIILKDGYIVKEWGDVERVDMCFSATKSFLSTLVGLAVSKNMFDENDPVSKLVWDGTFEGNHNSKITWKHLLQQSSDWEGSQFGLNDWADRPPKTGSQQEWIRRPLSEPGTMFEYNDVRVNVLAYSLLNVWRKPLPMILKDEIMDKINASTTWRWMGYDNAFLNIDGQMMQSVSGGGHHGGGIFMNTLDMARFGYFIAKNGTWNDQNILSRDWMSKATKPSISNKSYGYMWWLNQDMEWKGISPSIFYAVGYGGNYIIVDNENDLVIVTRWIDSNTIDKFVQMVLSSLKK
jgi:hypothetical protein